MTTIEPIVRVGFVFLCAYFTQQINSPPAQAQQGKKIAWELFLTAMKAWLAFQIIYTWLIAVSDGALTYLAYTDTSKFREYCPAGDVRMFTKPHASLYMGIGALISACLIRITAFRQLGEFFTFEVQAKEGHRLIQSGLYAWMRNPGYTGMMLFGLAYPFVFLRHGGPLDCQSGMLMAAFKIVITAIASGWSILLMRGRIEKEEAVLSHAFPEEWPRYVQRTRRFIPVIWFPGN